MIGTIGTIAAIVITTMIRNHRIDVTMQQIGVVDMIGMTGRGRVIVSDVMIVMNVMVMTGRVVGWVVIMRRDVPEGYLVTGKPIMTIMTIPSPFRTRGTTLPTALRGKFPCTLNPYHQST